MPEVFHPRPAAGGAAVIVHGERSRPMCTYLTEKVSITGSGKGPYGWFDVTDASVYFDHPVHAQAEHTLNIDFRDPGAGPAGGLAVERPPDAPRAWPKAIEAPLDPAPPAAATGPGD